MTKRATRRRSIGVGLVLGVAAVTGCGSGQPEMFAHGGPDSAPAAAEACGPTRRPGTVDPGGRTEMVPGTTVASSGGPSTSAGQPSATTGPPAGPSVSTAATAVPTGTATAAPTSGVPFRQQTPPQSAVGGAPPSSAVGGQPPSSAVGGQPPTTTPGYVDPSALMDDFGRAQDYGAAHPDEYSGARFDNPGTSDLVLAFTGHLDTHLAALQAVVDNPGRVRVEQACRTQIDLQALRDEISANPQLRGPGLMMTMGTNASRGVVTLALQPHGEPLARELTDRYGPSIEITVGLWRYPEGMGPAGPAAGGPTCPVSVDAYVISRSGASDPAGPGPGSGTVAGLRVELRIDEPPTVPGGPFRGHANFVNDGPTAVVVDDHALLAVILDDQRRVVGVRRAFQTLEGRWTTVQPGQRHDVEVQGDTGTCVPDTGFTLAPGPYQVVVLPSVTPVAAGAPSNMPGGPATIIVSEPAAVTAV